MSDSRNRQGGSVSPCRDTCVGGGGEPERECATFEGRHEEEDEEGEARRAVPLRDPGQPTAEEVRAHNITHLPFRSWCPDCVRGKAKCNPHWKGVAKDEHAIPTVAFDYWFASDRAKNDDDLTRKSETADDEDDSKCAPVLVAKDSHSKYVFASVVPRKGAEQWVVSLVVWWLDYLGYKSVILKCDGEHAIRDLVKQVKDSWSGSVMLEFPSTGDKRSNGMVERANQSVEDQVRVMKSALERRIRKEIPTKVAIVTWMIRQAGILLSRFEISKDGRTAYERLRGKRSNRETLEFGEKVHFLMQGARGSVGKINSAWMEGVYLGMREESTEHIIHTSEGIVRARSIRRVPIEDRWNAEGILAIAATPWNTRPSKEEKEDAAPTREKEDSRAKSDEHAWAEKDAVPKKAKITNEDLEEHGFTMGCPGCSAARRGAKGFAHSNACRLRFEQAWARTAKGRTKLERESDRVNRFLERRVKSGAAESEEAGRRDERRQEDERDCMTRQGRSGDEEEGEKRRNDDEGDCMTGRGRSGDEEEGEQRHDDVCLDGHRAADWCDGEGEGERRDDGMSEAQGKYKRHGAGEREEVPKKRRECLEGDQWPTVAQEKRARSSSADDGEEGMEEDAKRIRASEDAALVLHIGRMAWMRRQSTSAERRATEGEKGRRPREWDGKHEAIERTIREMSILGVDVDKMRARGEGSNEKWSEEEQDAMGALHDRDECAHDHGWDAFDDISGEMLDAELVKKARREEIQEFERIGVWQWTTVEECHRVTGKKPVGTRWVDVNKGDRANPEIRSRLVAQEFKVGSFADLFAGMPPLEAKKALFSLAASGLHASGNPLKLAFIDVKKAYLYAKVTRPTYVALPPEVAAPPRVCGRLMVSLYGTRDAAMNWEREYTDTLKAIGLVQGRSSPCIFYCERRDLRVVVHGGDFTVLSDRAGIDFVHAAMKKKYIVKLRGVLGPERGDDKEIRILNRVLRYTESGLELEADQRHAEILVRDIGVMGSKGVNTPGVKERGESPLKSQALRLEDARVFRMLVARGNYLAQDRPDIQFSVKELSRAMSSPS